MAGKASPDPVLSWHLAGRRALLDPELYIPANLFEQRLIAIRQQGYNVLPLDDALRRLHAGELPPQSICLTFDDGFHDFRAVAYPLLQEYGMPATVYLTSFYSEYRRPVFDLMCGYLLWKARDCTLDTALLASTEAPLLLPSAAPGSASQAPFAISRMRTTIPPTKETSFCADCFATRHRLRSAGRF